MVVVEVLRGRGKYTPKTINLQVAKFVFCKETRGRVNQVSDNPPVGDNPSHSKAVC